ncbi:MAG: DedA family protein [Myxococcales bacterium]|nr:DedA family protein [Myxococcales bacterium]
MLDPLLSWLYAMGGTTNSPTVLAMLAAAAATEYIVPPFPGDTITLLGGVLVGAFSWSFALVLAAVMLGSVSGSMVAYAVGRRLRTRQPSLATGKGRLARIVRQFDRRGTWYLLINRFLPGIRPLFFVASGLANMPPLRVALLSTISAALWNVAIIVAGIAVGDNLGRLEELLVQYSTAAWLILLGVVLFFALRRLFHRSNTTSESD